MTDSRFELHFADYIIFMVIIFVSLAIGVYQALSGSRQRTTSEYLVGDRKMGYISVSFSYTATFMSSIFYLGTPAEMYAYGIAYLFAFYGTIISNIMAAIYTVPLFHPLKLTSAFEYFELRFSSVAVRKMGSIFGIMTNVLYMGVVLYGPAVALMAVASFPLWSSVLTIGTAAVIYTAILDEGSTSVNPDVGGIKAVVWTDVFQSAIMICGLTAIVAKSLYDIGGINRFWSLNSEGQRLVIDFRADPTISRTFWSCLFGGTMKWFSFSFNQSSVLRYASIPSLKDARKMILMSTPTFLILATAAAFEGLCAYAYYSNKRCDPFQEGVISNSNEILPYFLMELFHSTPGLPGLFLASLFSASLSTLSSCLSSVSACTLTDFVRPSFPNVTEVRATVIAKLLVVVYGAAAVGLSFLIMQISGTVTQIATSLLGAVDGPICGLFLLGGLVPFANRYGALSGGIVGVGVTLWVSLGASFSGISNYPWLAPAPTDGCAVNESIWMSNTTGAFRLNNMTSPSIVWSEHATPSPGQLVQSEPAELTGLEQWYSLTFLYHTLLGTVVAFFVGIIVSLITGPTKPSRVNPAYVSYLVRRFYYSQQQLDDLKDELENLDERNLTMLLQKDKAGWIEYNDRPKSGVVFISQHNDYSLEEK